MTFPANHLSQQITWLVLAN